MTVPELRITWYGDDFTGSTDAMEALTLAGIPAALFLEIPEPGELASSRLQAVGIAGNTRGMGRDGIERTLRPALTRLRALGAPFCHYKVCSTFDSSPDIGNIGLAIEIGQDIFKTGCVPVIVGAPALGRYVVFGNLFARSGRESEIFRLDRHPTMRRHPITPMDESDLRLHLARQTDLRISLFDVNDLSSADSNARLISLLQSDSPGVVLFDTLDERDLPVLGRLIERIGAEEDAVYAVGSSGVEYALTAHWRETGSLPDADPLPSPGSVEQVIVLSGSCSPVTERQISSGLAAGYAEVSLHPERLLDADQRSGEIDRVVELARAPLEAGKSIVMHTCLGPDDARIGQVNQVLVSMEWSPLEIRLGSGELLGGALGKVLRALLEVRPVQRTIVAGGDTSYYVARALGIRSLRMVAPTAPGSPLCRAAAPGSPVDDAEITFKGGQVGNIEFFEGVRLGVLT